eukprot:151634_1
METDQRLQHNLKSGKVALAKLEGFGWCDAKYIGSYHDIITELNTLLRTKKHDGLFDKRCRCDDVILNGYNLKVICLTIHCDIACKCGTLYMKYAFGKQVMIDNKLYHENMLRFTSLVTHMKVRYSLAEKLDLYFGFKAPDPRTFRRYKNKTDDIGA